MEIDSVWNRLCALYRSCSSYKDQGALALRFLPDTAEEHEKRKNFRTYFGNPDKFLLTWIDREDGSEQQESAAWCDGTQSRICFNGKVRDTDNLERALNIISGISGRLPCLIPALLMPQLKITREQLPYIEDPIISRECDEPFWQITGKLSRTTAISMWLDEGLLVRRVIERREITKDATDIALRRAISAITGDTGKHQASLFNGIMKVINSHRLQKSFTVISEINYEDVEVDAEISDEIFRYQASQEGKPP